MYYIYKTTNLINNKIYIGLHKSENIEKDNYIGSGTAFLKALEKYGRHNFKREILYEVNTLNEASDLESKIVNEEFVRDENNYNLKTGGIAGWMLEPHNIGKIAITSPISKKIYYIEEHDLQSFLDKGYVRGQWHDGRNCIHKDGIIKYVTNTDLSESLDNGWERWNTTKDKVCMTHIDELTLIYVNAEEVQYYEKKGYKLGNLLSGVNKNTIYITKNCENKRIYPNDLEKYKEEGWIPGRYQRKINIKRMYNPETGELRNINKEDVDMFLLNGWKFGVNYTSANKNSIYITKDKKNKRISIKDLDVYLLDGWKKGMYNKKYNNE